MRAFPALGNGADGPEKARDRILEALKPKLDSGWIARPAGLCPDHMPVLDLFQLPVDLVQAADGPMLRFRLEWHHQAGETEFFAPCPGRAAPSPIDLAAQLTSVVRQMFAVISLRSNPEPVDLRILNLPNRDWRTPLQVQIPPGAFFVSFLHDGVERRKDTTVSVGGLYEIRADFLPKHLDPDVGSGGSRPKTWPWWTATALAVCLSAVFEYRQIDAQRAYSDLGPRDSRAKFDQTWSDLRQANLLRNSSLGLTLLLGASSSWLEWGRAH